MVMGSLKQEAEVAVIGGGPGRYVAAIRAADLGKEVVLIEERERLKTDEICTAGRVKAMKRISFSDNARSAKRERADKQMKAQDVDGELSLRSKTDYSSVLRALKNLQDGRWRTIIFDKNEQIYSMSGLRDAIKRAHSNKIVNVTRSYKQDGEEKKSKDVDGKLTAVSVRFSAKPAKPAPKK